MLLREKKLFSSDEKKEAKDYERMEENKEIEKLILTLVSGAVY